MAQVSAGGIWSETRAVVARHWQVFVTLAGATVFLPNAAMRLLTPAVASGGFNPAAPPVLPPGFWTLIALVLALQFVGVFAISAITADRQEGGGRTLGRTLGDAAPALGKFILALLLFIVAYGVATVVLSLVLAIVAGIVSVASPGTLAGAGKGTAPMALATTVVAIVVPVMMWLWARLITVVGVYLREPVGVVAGIRRAWGLTRSTAWPILGLLTGFVLASVLVGALQVSAGDAVGSGLPGTLVSLVFAAVSTLLFVYAAAATGVIYRQLSA